MTIKTRLVIAPILAAFLIGILTSYIPKIPMTNGTAASAWALAIKRGGRH